MCVNASNQSTQKKSLNTNFFCNSVLCCPPFAHSNTGFQMSSLYLTHIHQFNLSNSIIFKWYFVRWYKQTNMLFAVTVAVFDSIRFLFYTYIFDRCFGRLIMRFLYLTTMYSMSTTFCFSAELVCYLYLFCMIGVIILVFFTSCIIFRFWFGKYLL